MTEKKGQELDPIQREMSLRAQRAIAWGELMKAVAQEDLSLCFRRCYWIKAIDQQLLDIEKLKLPIIEA